MSTRILDVTHRRLGWPERREIFDPSGPGPGMYAELARRKLQTAIRRQGIHAQIGVLSANPASAGTENPLAVVCESTGQISPDNLREVHRLVWSFSRSPMLITVEPGLLRAWSCWKRPLDRGEKIDRLVVEEVRVDGPGSLSDQAAKSLAWVELLSGRFFKHHARHFNRSHCADRLMLDNLKDLRHRLLGDGLPEDICHDLLARVIFIEFLFQRKDSQGNSALNASLLRNMHKCGILSAAYDGFPEILENPDDTYRFFRKLDDRFNGDLFPGKEDTPQERNAAWKRERGCAEKHLKKLAEFVRGEMEMRNGQRCLWRQYAFDVIPLEFISSIYEEFVTKKPKAKDKQDQGEETSSGVHYTPGHLVDFMLDRVLPWDSKEWDLKILDPSCGSGIFLVKAYQRLIHRWRRANRRKPRAEDLRSLLENNLFGVDIAPEAVRVASFSLYLAMCDELEPRHVWQQVKFPRLHNRRLIEADFFSEDTPGFRTEKDAGTYDLVIGNAPWDQGSDTKDARKWARSDPQNVWDIPHRNVGPLFLPKAAALTKADRRIAMLQPAQTMLSNTESPTLNFRRMLFGRYKVECVVNLAALRYVLFPKAVSPACIVVMRPTPRDGQPMEYVFPKRSHAAEERCRIVVEAHDMAQVHPQEAAADPLIWTSLAWGSRRDVALVRRLEQEQCLDIRKLEEGGIAKTRRGIGRGGREMRQDGILGMPLLDSEAFPPNTFLRLNAGKLEPNRDPFVHKGHSKDLTAFDLPQMILKLAWRQKDHRFRAVLVNPGIAGRPVLCSRSYVSVHVPEEHLAKLESACLSLNSVIAVYYTFLSNGRFAFYRPEPNKEALLRTPLPEPRPDMLEGIRTFRDVDDRVKHAFGLKDAEWVLVQDLFNYTLPDFKGGPDSPGRKPTREVKQPQGRERILTQYIEYFRKVLKAGFGEDKGVSATVFAEGASPFLPVRLVAIHLDSPKDGMVGLEEIDSDKLLQRLRDLDDRLLKSGGNPQDGGVLYQRVARVYDTVSLNGHRTPTIFLVKPDQIRYWTRSRAMSDADEAAADIMLWPKNPRTNSKKRQE